MSQKLILEVEQGRKPISELGRARGMLSLVKARND